jgi:hypothetical protein
MKHRGESPEVAALKTHWRRWVGVVHLFASRRPGRRRVETQEYRILHKELMERCRALVASTNEVDRAFYRYLEDLAQPWLSLAVLAKADREIVIDLLERCRQVDHQLGGRSWARSVPPWVQPALLAGIVIFSLLLVLFMIQRLGFPAVQRIQNFLDDLWIAIRWSSDLERLTFVGVVLLVMSFFAISRTAKS